MGDTGEGEGSHEAADAKAAEAAGDAGGWRRPVRPVALVAGMIAGVVILGAVALAARGGDPSPSPDASTEVALSERSTSTTTEPVETTATSTTVAPTTTAAAVSESIPTTAGPAPPRSVPPATQAPSPRHATCNPLWPPGTGPMPTVFAPPDKFVAFAPPAASCVNEADGCLVAVTLRWSDGYTEVGSAVLAEPGQYTVNGDRGTTWNFTVTNDRVCVSNGGSWSNTWPPGT